MKLIYALFFSCYLTTNLFSQISDDFETSHFNHWTQSPSNRWERSNLDPLNGTYSLRHSYDNSLSGADAISIPVPNLTMNAPIKWRFLVKYKYSPSASNNWNIFLMSNGYAEDMVQAHNMNAYIVGVNFSGNDDRIKMWKYTNGIDSLILDTHYNWEDSIGKTNIAAIEIIRSSMGLFELFISTDIDFSNMQKIGEIINTDFTHNDYFGWYYKYTASADRKLILDDFSVVGTILVDTIPPEIISVNANLQNKLELTFSDALDNATVLNNDYYSVDHEIGKPINISFSNTHKVFLEFETNFESDQEYTLRVDSIADIKGNVMLPKKVKFTFENIKIDSIKLKSKNELWVYFNKELDTISAKNNVNYNVSNNVGYPNHILFLSNKTVQLIFNTPFPSLRECFLSISNIEDVWGNNIKNVQLPFSIYIPQIYDIVFSEIMADPSPILNSLPEYEYVEIVNRSEYPINLKNWIFQNGNKQMQLPDVIISPHEYAILCSDKAENSMNKYGKTIGLKGFTSLNNTEQRLILFDDEAHLISQITYSKIWHSNNYTSDGGFSLECVDIDNVCGGKNNWTSSLSSRGGTLGKQNSLLENNPDVILPFVKRIGYLNDSSMQIFFNEDMYIQDLINRQNYIINNHLVPSKVAALNYNLSVATLYFDRAFHPNKNYNILVKNTLKDCADNPLTSEYFGEFILPDSMIKKDVLINEILFNPFTDGEDFIELYNNSTKAFDLSNLLIANRNDLGEATNFTKIELKGYLLLPQNYVLISKNLETIAEHYDITHTNNFIDLNSFPSYPDDKGYVLLVDKYQNIIDELNYDENMHFTLLSDVEGVSLERININENSNNTTNWHSASSGVGYATPGYKNSQSFANKTNSENVFSLGENSFTPDNDGIDDLLSINCKLNENGVTNTIDIYNSAGQKVANIIENELLDTERTFYWDGLNDYGHKVPVGIYIVLCQYTSLKTGVKIKKLPVVVSATIN